MRCLVPRRRVPAAAVVLAMCCALLAGAAPAAADQVAVRAGAHADFGRIAFEWPTPIDVAAVPPEEPDRLILRFSRPFAGDLAAVAGRIPSYVRAAEPGARPDEVVLHLQPDTRHKLFTVERRIVVVDLSRADPELPTVRVRTGRHADHGRIVFDLPFPADHRVEREDGRVVIRFDRPVRVDAAAIARDLAPLVGEAAAERDADSTRVLLRVPVGAELRDFTVVGNRVVVDVFEAPAGRRAATPEVAAQPAGEAPRTAAHAVSDEPVVSASGSPPPPASGPAAAADAAGSRDAPAAVPPLTLAVSSAAVDGGVELRFDWSLPVAAAVFVRAGYLWTVFAGEPAGGAGSAVPPLDAALGDVLGPGEVVGADGGLAVRFPLRRDVQPGVGREGGRWRVTLRGAAPPPRALEPRRRGDPARLFFPGAGIVARFDDPEVGDRLNALPLLEAGRGQPEPRRLVDLKLLATAQGIVWQTLTDGVRAQPVEGGIELGAPDGLRLTILPDDDGRAARAATMEPDRARAARAPLTEEASPATEPEEEAAAMTEPAGPGPPLGLAAATPVVAEPTWLARRTLSWRVVAAPADRRDAARIDLARFLLSRALAAEALAVLGAVGTAATSASPAAAVPTAVARDSLTGAAQLLMGRLPEAATALEAQALDGDPEAALWRAVLAAVENDWQRAARELERSGKTLAAYPPPLRVRLGLTAALIALEAGDPDGAFAVIDGLKDAALDPADWARLRFTEGLALARDGAVIAAVEAWREVATDGPPETRQKALYACTALLLQTGQIDAPEAIARLEAARPFWRGHVWEVTMLDGLARAYAQRRDYHRALQTWKEAITRRPDAAETTAIAEAMGELYVTALIADGDDAPPAFEALKIHRDFPELTPAGPAGDRLARRLAERLAAFDLVDDAADLLERQVRYRLRGIEKAEAGVWLAELRLQGHAPSAALDALRTSDTVAELPAALVQRRRLAEARALAAVGRTDEALAGLEGDAGRAAEHVRVTVHWDRRDWPNVIAAVERLLAGRGGPDDPLGPEERDLVLRLALARAQIDDREGLRALRGRFDAALAGSPEHAAFVVATDDGPAAGDPHAVLARAAHQVDAVRALLGGPGQGG